MPSKRRIQFIVDGKSERAILEKLNQTSIIPNFVKRLKNGKDVTIEAIANECVNFLRAGSHLAEVIIIIIDREGRTETSDQLKNKIRTLIAQKCNVQYDLVIADRMFENWIIADIENVALKNPGLLSPAQNSAQNEGTNGSAKLDHLWISKNGEKFSSDKIGNCKKLFKSVRIATGANFSNSLNEFQIILTNRTIQFH